MSTLFPLPATWNFCVCTDKTSKWSIAAKGTEIFLSAGGSCSPERPKTEKGNSVKSWMTSPTFFLQNSWETVGSENHLSKPDVREIAKAYPRIPAGGHKSSGISQTAEVDVGCSAGEEPFTSCSETPSLHMGGGFYLLHRKTWRHWSHQQQVTQKEPGVPLFAYSSVSVTPNTSWHQGVVGGSTILLWGTSSCTMLWCLHKTLCLSEPSLMVKFYCLPGAISPLIPSLHPVRWFLSSSVVSELLLRSGSHCDSCKGASFSKPVVLFLSCFCWLLGVLGVLFTPSLWVLQREQ